MILPPPWTAALRAVLRRGNRYDFCRLMDGLETFRLPPHFIAAVCRAFWKGYHDRRPGLRRNSPEWATIYYYRP